MRPTPSAKAALLGSMLVSSWLVAHATADEPAMVPFVIPLEVSEKSLIAFPSGKPITPDGQRLSVRDGHFFAGDGRFRAWGVNFCFGANFPDRREAELTARRLAAFGVNSVRLHHLDMSAYPNGIWDANDPLKLSAEALDRLDYFIDRLARHGIRTNLNLHVSRTHAKAVKLPQADKMPSMDKIVGIFMPQLVEAQKDYARQLLGHVNAYRKVRYADDPAIAFVEITNENSFFMWGGEAKLRSLPESCQAVLRERFNEYLKARYRDDEGLRRAWNAGGKLGANMIPDPTFRKIADKPGAGWYVERHAGVIATATAREESGIRIQQTGAAAANTEEQTWHLQLNYAGLKLKKGQHYAISFRARAAEPRPITFGVFQARQPWQPLHPAKTIDVAKTWKTYRLGFVSGLDDDNARMSFLLAKGKAAVELDDCVLAEGDFDGVSEGELIAKASVALFGDIEPQRRVLDRMMFLATIEKAYFDGMRQFIKNDLGCGALVTGTIVFGPLGLWTQSDMDFIDGHAYWQHPHFPREPWHAVHWTVEQKPMLENPAQSPLFDLACQRLEGKPFTVTEYNHSAPNDFQNECVPFISTFAASQDWDGVWLFAYSHSRETPVDRFSNFFDIAGNPAKWGFMPAGAVIFRDGGIEPDDPRVIDLTATRGNRPAHALDALSELHRFAGLNMFEAAESIQRPLNRPFYSPSRISVRLNQPAAAAPTTRVRGRGKSSLLLSRMGSTKPEMYGAEGRGAWVSVSLVRRAAACVSLDGKPLADTRKVLLITCGRCENTGMKFSEDRRSVGKDWGVAPVLIEAATDPWGPTWSGAGLPPDEAVTQRSYGKWQCQALAPDGTPSADVPKVEGGFKLDPKYKTMWYLLTR